MRSITNGRISRILPIEAWLALLVLAYHLFFVQIVQDLGWDDGAITLSFSRTLSGFGKIALTPNSEVVEGYSSTLWMIAMAVFHRAFQPDFSQFIRISQVFASLLCSASAVLFFTLFRRVWNGSALPAAFIVSLLLFIQAPFLNESVNGMEMQAASMFALSLMLIVARASRSEGEEPDRNNLTLLTFVSGISSLNRFEFLFYLLGASLFLFRSSRKLALSIAIGGSIGFTGSSIHRLIYFNDVLPNTIYAKRWPPYKYLQADDIRTALSRLNDAFSGGLEIFQSNQLFFVTVFGLLLFLAIPATKSHALAKLPRQTLLDPPTAYAFGFCLFVILFSMITGKNWGYESRMQLSAVSLLVLTISFWLKQLSLTLDATVSSAVPLYLAASLATASLIHLPYPGAARAGTAYNILRRDPLDSELLEKGFGISPASYQYTAQSIDRLRVALGRKTIKFMAPDVGGLALESPSINVLDSALLTNRELAHAGYSKFTHYFTTEKPDVIETHDPWSTLSGIHEIKEFQDNYSPIIVDANWLYIRNDHLNRLRQEGALKTVTCESGCKHYRYRGSPSDESYIASRGHAHKAEALPPLWEKP